MAHLFSDLLHLKVNAYSEEFDGRRKKQMCVGRGREVGFALNKQCIKTLLSSSVANGPIITC